MEKKVVEHEHESAPTIEPKNKKTRWALIILVTILYFFLRDWLSLKAEIIFPATDSFLKVPDLFFVAFLIFTAPLKKKGAPSSVFWSRDKS